jgi:DNA gyrase subunit B
MPKREAMIYLVIGYIIDDIVYPRNRSGITVTNALSSYFSLETYRGDYYHKIEFKDGQKVGDTKGIPTKKGKKHGTIVSFISNPIYLGAGSHLPFDKVREWVTLMSYQLDYNIEFHLEEWEGLKIIKKETIKRKDFSDMIFSYIQNPKDLIVQPISLSAKENIVEEIKRNIVDDNGKVKTKKEKMKKQVSLSFAFAYDEGMEVDERSFCNFTQTDDGGVHVESVEEVICRYFQQQTRDSLSEAQRAKTPILFQDVKAGLKLVVNLSTNAQVQFMGNAKNRIQNENLRPVLKDMTSKALTDFFANDQARLQAIIKVVKANAKARIELQKAKSVNVSKKVDTFAEYELANFIKCNNTGNKYKELFLIEGRKSAAGSMVNGRDAATQAIFGFRGVTANAFKKSLPEIMENGEWKQYVRVLHTGIGQSFDIRRLYYNKIIISTDADIDGFWRP